MVHKSLNSDIYSHRSLCKWRQIYLHLSDSKTEAHSTEELVYQTNNPTNVQYKYDAEAAVVFYVTCRLSSEH